MGIMGETEDSVLAFSLCYQRQAWPGLSGQWLLILIWASCGISTFLAVHVRSGHPLSHKAFQVTLVKGEGARPQFLLPQAVL